MSFLRFNERLREKAGDARARAVTYVAMGDSVTQGCMELGVSEYERVYHQVAKREIERRYPGTVLNVINSGVGGDTAAASRVRWERDILLYKPDLVTICFGHNDAHGREEGLEPFAEAIADLVGRIRSDTEAELLLMTPCMMTDRDNDAVAAEHKTLIPAFVRLAEDGILEKYADRIRALSAELNVPLMDIHAMWQRMVRDGERVFDRLSNGINHPDARFHVTWGGALAKMLLLDRE